MLALTALLCVSCSRKQDNTEQNTKSSENTGTTATENPQSEENTKSEESTPTAETAAPKAAEMPKPSPNKCGRDDIDPEATKDWVCLTGMLHCLNKKGCEYKGKKAPMRAVLFQEHFYCDGTQMPEDWSGLKCLNANDEDDDADRDAGLICAADSCKCGTSTIKKDDKCLYDKGDILPFRIDDCAPYNAHQGAICKDNKEYCGNEPFPGTIIDGNDWRCVNQHWICVANACGCGNQKIGKFGTCKGGQPYCGKKKMAALPENTREGYVCQNGKWLCAAPGGCGKCSQYQTLNADGKCEGKDINSKAIFDECKEGNCPCGDGACPKGGTCITLPDEPPTCVCGDIDLGTGCEDRKHFPLYSNQYGEFECIEQHEPGSSGGGDYYADVECNNPNGCNILGENPNPGRKKKDDDDDDWWSVEDLFAASIKDEKRIDALKEALIARQLDSCGRKTALEFTAGKDGSPWMKEQYNHKTNKTVKTDEPEKNSDSCKLRQLCDTMPVPRDKRKNFICDNGHDRFGSEPCYSSLDYPHTIIGLRCISDKNCTCNQETCAKGALCHDGACTFDTLYAHQYCQNVFPHLAEDEDAYEMDDIGGASERASGVGSIRINPPNSKEYAKEGDIALIYDSFYGEAYPLDEKLLLWDIYKPDVAGSLVTLNGTCICGYSQYTPQKLKDYKCVQSLGYVCINGKGCACGNTTCNKGTVCLREGLCSGSVMEKGLAPEKITTRRDDEG